MFAIMCICNSDIAEVATFGRWIIVSSFDRQVEDWIGFDVAEL